MPVAEDGTVACAACGTLDEPASQLLAGLRMDIEGLERELRAKRRRIKELQAEQDGSLKASKYYATAMRILERWKSLCAPDTRELTGNHRLERVIARLKGGHTEAELLEAVEGYARFPYVVDRDRSPAGRADQWYADAELIFRTPGHVKRGRAMATQEFRFPVGALAQVSWGKVREANRRAMVQFLSSRFGAAIEEDGYLLWPCPSCSDSDGLVVSLRVAPLAGVNFDAWLVDCHSCGLSDDRMLRLMAKAVAPERRTVSAEAPQLSLGVAS